MSVYNDGELLAIEFKVSIDGVELDQYRRECITNIDIKETVDKANSATINISDPDMIFIEDDIFLEDKTIDIQMWWSNTTYIVSFSGYISGIDIDFPSDAVPTLTVNCLDETYKMDKEKKDNTYENTTSAEVVKQKAEEYGFKCVIEDGYEFPIQETITQSDQSDIEFIRSLAENEVAPFASKLEDGTLYYTKKGTLGEVTCTLTYREYPHEIISFSPSIDKTKKQDKVESATMETSDKNVDSASTTDKSNATGKEEKALINDKGMKFNPVSETWSSSKNKNTWS